MKGNDFMMKITVTPALAKEIMVKVNRDNFTMQALDAILDYYENADVEFDPVTLDCEWTEYTSIERLWNDYDYIVDNEDDPSDADFIEKLSEYTIVIELANKNILIQDF